MPVATAWSFKTSGELQAPSALTLCTKRRPFGIGRFGVGLYSRYQPGEWPLPRPCDDDAWTIVEPCGCSNGSTSTTTRRRS